MSIDYTATNNSPPPRSDWGVIYTHTPTASVSDTGMIMPIRSYYIRKMNAGRWADLSIGFFFSVMATSSDPNHYHDDIVADRQDEGAVSNLFHFGLTRAFGAEDLDVNGNSYFLGMRGQRNGVSAIQTSPLQLGYLKHACVYNDVEASSGSAFNMPLGQGVGSNCYIGVGLRFYYDGSKVYTNFATLQNFTLGGPTDNIAKMQDFLNNIPNTKNTAQANFSVSSVEEFNTFYIYWPYKLNQLKLHCLGGIKSG